MKKFILLFLLLISGFSFGGNVVVVNPGSPGNGQDVLFRVIDAELAKRNIKTTIEYKPGADGVIASDYFKKLPPGGDHLIIVNTEGFFIFHEVFYKNTNKFVPLTLVGKSYYVLFGSKNVDLPTLLAKLNTESQTVGVSGVNNQAVVRLFQLRSGRPNIELIKYKGPVQVITETIGGTLNYGLTPISVVTPFVASGKIKMVGVSSKKRLPELPDTPAISEFVPGFYSDLSWSLLLPENTPKSVVDYYESVFKEVLMKPDIQKFYKENLIYLNKQEIGQEPLVRYINNTRTMWNPLVPHLVADQ